MDDVAATATRAPKALKLTRRALLGSFFLTGAYLVASRKIASLSFEGPAAAAAPLASKPLVDAHCHIFNVRDVPVAEFMSNVLIREKLYGRYGRSVGNAVKMFAGSVLGKVDAKGSWWQSATDAKVVRLLTYIHQVLAEQTMTIDSEIEELRQLATAGKTIDYTVPDFETDAARLREIMITLPKATGFEDIRDVIESDLITRIITILSKKEEEEDEEVVAAGPLPPEKEVDAKLLKRLLELVKYKTDAQRNWAAHDIARLTYSAPGNDSAIAAYLRFLVSSTHRRVEILAQANELFGSVGDLLPGSNVRVFTPSSIDFDCWLRGLPRSEQTQKQAVVLSPLSKQAEFYGLLAKAQPQGMWVHHFMGYDPLRHAVSMFDETREANGVSVCSDTQRKANEKEWPSGIEDPLTILQNAVLKHGCVGAKLYPPMGFRAFANAEIDKDKRKVWRLDGLKRRVSPFGPLMIRTQEAFCREFRGQPGDRLGPLLDFALQRFYKFCLDEDVAIMAHCSRTQGSFGLVGSEKARDAGAWDPRAKRYNSQFRPHLAAERASPEHWIKLLKSTGPNGETYANLRLNFAHAGGIWCIGAVRGQGEIDKANRDELRTVCEFTSSWTEGPTWFHRIAHFVGSEPTRYPNVYCDIADWSDPVGDAPQAEFVARELVRVIARFPAMRNRILYGSDWLCMGTKARYQDYFNKMHALLAKALSENDKTKAQAGEIMADIFGRNAIRYLGLPQGQKTRDRLEAFYGGRRDLSVFDELLS
jgi:hypothetical protein